MWRSIITTCMQVYMYATIKYGARRIRLSRLMFLAGRFYFRHTTILFSLCVCVCVSVSVSVVCVYKPVRAANIYLDIPSSILMFYKPALNLTDSNEHHLLQHQIPPFPSSPLAPPPTPLISLKPQSLYHP